MPMVSHTTTPHVSPAHKAHKALLPWWEGWRRLSTQELVLSGTMLRATNPWAQHQAQHSPLLTNQDQACSSQLHHHSDPQRPALAQRPRIHMLQSQVASLSNSKHLKRDLGYMQAAHHLEREREKKKNFPDLCHSYDFSHSQHWPACAPQHLLYLVEASPSSTPAPLP